MNTNHEQLLNELKIKFDNTLYVTDSIKIPLNSYNRGKEFYSNTTFTNDKTKTLIELYYKSEILFFQGEYISAVANCYLQLEIIVDSFLNHVIDIDKINEDLHALHINKKEENILLKDYIFNWRKGTRSDSTEFFKILDSKNKIQIRDFQIRERINLLNFYLEVNLKITPIYEYKMLNSIVDIRNYASHSNISNEAISNEIPLLIDFNIEPFSTWDKTTKLLKYFINSGNAYQKYINNALGKQLP